MLPGATLTSPVRAPLNAGYGAVLASPTGRAGTPRLARKHAGKALWVAAAAAEAHLPASEATLHTVQTGETLAQIALAYGVSVEQIQEAAPKGRTQRASLRKDSKLQAGQQLLVASEQQASTAAPGSAAAAGGLAGFIGQHGPVMAACVGGALLAAGAVKVLSPKAGPKGQSEKAAEPVPATSPPVMSAVAQVRALLQDAAVEMQAVEAALAAVKRASAAAATPAAAPAAAAVAAVAATATEQAAPAAEGAVETAAADVEAPAEPASTVTAEVPVALPAAEAPAGGAEAAAAEVAAVPDAMIEETANLDTSAQVAAARARVKEALEAAQGLMLSVPLHGAGAGAAVAAVPGVAVGGGADTPAATLAAAQLPVMAAEALEAVVRPMGVEAAGQVLDRIRSINQILEQEQQRAEVAALRAASTVEAAATGDAATAPAEVVDSAAKAAVEATAAAAEAAPKAVAEAAAPAVEAVGILARAAVDATAAVAGAAPEPMADAAKEAVAAAARAANDTVAAAVDAAVDLASSAAATTQEAVAAVSEAAVSLTASFEETTDAAPKAVAEAADAAVAAVNALAQAAVDATTFVTGAAPEGVAEAAKGAVAAAAKAATDAAKEAADSAVGLAAAAAGSTNEAVAGAAGAAISAAAAAAAVVLPVPEAPVAAAASPVVLSDKVLYDPPSPEATAALMSERAGSVLQSIDLLIASFEGLSDDDEQALEDVMRAGEAKAAAKAAAAAKDGDGLLPPPTAPAAPLNVPPSFAAAADSSTTANLVLNLPPITAPAGAAAPAAAPVAVPAPEPVLVGAQAAAQPAATAAAAPPEAATPPSAAERAAAMAEMLAPLRPSVPGPVLDRLAQLMMLMPQDQVKDLSGAIGESAAAAAVTKAATTKSTEIPADPWQGVPPAIVAALNRIYKASIADEPAAPGAVRGMLPPAPAAAPRPLLPPGPQRAALPPTAATATASASVAAPAARPMTSMQFQPQPQPSMQAPNSSPSPLPPSAPQPSPSLPPPPPPQPNPTLQRAVAAAAARTAGPADGPTPAAAGPDAAATLVHLKSGLLDLVYGTARGVNAAPVTRAAIEEFVSALEARNPHTVPTDAVSALAGRWKLVYTSNVGTLMLLGALDNLPLVDVGDVCQTIDPVTLTAINKIDIAVPVLLSLRAEAGLEVRSPRQFKVQFTRVGLDTYIRTPQLTAALEIPPSVTVLGATLDLSPLRRLVEPINSGLEAASDLLGRAVSPEFGVNQVPVPPGMSAGTLTSAASLWMLTTYLDDNLRISRDDEGRVFVMLKDVAWPGPDSSDLNKSPR